MPSRVERRFLAICAVFIAGLTALIAARNGMAPKSGKDRTAVLSGHRFPVLALAFDSDSHTLTSAAGFQTNPREEVELIVWNLASGSPVLRQTGFQANLAALAISQNGAALATAAGSGALRMWHVGSLHGTGGSDDCQSSLCCLAFSADGSKLASASRQNELILWDSTGVRLWSRPAGHDRFAQSLAFSPDGRTLASGGSDGTVRLWDVATGKSSRTILAYSTPVLAATFAPDGRTLATGDRTGIVKIWDVATGESLASLVANGGESAASKFVEEIAGLAFSPDGQTLAVAVGPSVQIWDVSSSQPLSILTGHDGKVHCLAYSHDGKLLASGGQNGLVRVWEIARF
jgi:WD40 repeat protein